MEPIKTLDRRLSLPNACGVGSRTKLRRSGHNGTNLHQFALPTTAKNDYVWAAHNLCNNLQPMNANLFVTLTALLLAASSLRSSAADPNAVATEMKEVITRIQTKLKDAKTTEADLYPELTAFDALLAKHKDERTDEVAQVLYMKATLYSEVLRNETKANELLEQLKREFPNSKPVAAMKRQEAAKKIQAGLVEGSPFPDFNEKDTAGQPLSIAGYKGKVVLIDFWATWCGPCVAELPNVIKAYEKNHRQGFEIIGISLDSDQKKLETFVKQKKMNWQQYFDGQGWQNKLAQQYGVNSIPATYLLDRQGKIIAKGLRGENLETAIATALAAK
jgi:peroxiredoxin